MASLPSNTDNGCYIFIDGSCLWTPDKSAGPNADKRHRIDHGSFLDLVAQKRPIANVYVYGSTAPPNDTIWRTSKEQNYRSQTSKHSRSRQDNELDLAMACDIMKELYEMEDAENATFIIVTGSRDFMPPIKHCLDKKARVELWSWECDHMARSLRKLGKKRNMISAKLLDEVKDHLRYTTNMTIKRVQEIDPQHAIVFNNIQINAHSIMELADHLTCLLRIFYIIPTDDESLVVQSLNSNPKHMLTNICTLGYYQPSKYEDRRRSQRRQSAYLFEADSDIDEESLPEGIAQSLQIEDMREESEEASVSSFVTITSDDSDTPSDYWIAKIPEWQASLQQQQGTQCPWRDHCAFGVDCHNFHTPQEIEFFQSHPDSHNRFRYKTKLCNKRHWSKEQKEMCTYAHGEDEAWCRICKDYGHLQETYHHRRQYSDN